MTVAADTRPEVVAELRRLWARLPVPDARWHAYVPRIAAVRDDFAAAIERAIGNAEALDRFAALAAGETEPVFDAAADPGLTEAYERLRALPRPEGQHPFLDEIVPALEAAELLLVALAGG